MNNIKHASLLDRLRAAGRAFMGKPTKSITFGVEIKRCSECERGYCEVCGYKVHSEGVCELPDCNDCARKDCQYEPKPVEKYQDRILRAYQKEVNE